MKNTKPTGGSSSPTTLERIQARAYELYLARGEVAGRDREDWFEAERQILASDKRLNRDGDVAAASLSDEPPSANFPIDGASHELRTRDTSRRARS